MGNNDLDAFDPSDEFDDSSDEDFLRAKIINRGAPPAHWEGTRLKFFSIQHAQEIRAMGAGLSREDVLNYYGLTESTIEMLGSYDQWFFDTEFMRGRVQAKRTAVESLFNQMNGRQGAQASLAYLQRFSNSFKGGTDGLPNMPKSVEIKIVD